MGSMFLDRRDAGRRVAARLLEYAGDPNVTILALPRGGVPVGYEVAHALDAPLDLFVVRKLGVPGQEEMAMGAIASGGVRVLNEDLIGYLDISDDAIERVTREEQEELRRREKTYRAGASPLDVEGRMVILVDDGLATGATMKAAVAALRALRPEKIIVAVPTAEPTVCAEMRRLADECICASTPVPFRAVGMWYDDFSQTTDEEVRMLIKRNKDEQKKNGGATSHRSAA